jgi:hypothetical protein
MATVEKNQTGGIPMTETEKRIWDDIEWADKNEDVQRKYGGEWVAILDRKIVAHGMDRDVVVKEAVAATNRPEEEIAVWSVMSPEAWTEFFLTDFPRDEVF